MLFFHKLLPIFALPLGWVLALLGYALLSKKRWPTITALALLYVASMPAMGSLLLGCLESRYRPVAFSDLEHADAVVVLSGFLGPPAAPGYLPNVTEAGERLEAGIVLWQQKKAEWLVFTGGRLPWDKQAEADGERAKRIAVARGIPQEQVIVTRDVGNTAEESLAVAELMRGRGWRRIVLVTSAWHMPRATRLFRKAGMEVIAFPVDYRVSERGKATMLDFLPNAEGLRKTECGLRELYGLGFYAVGGR